MNILLLGLPGCGKGTQAKKLSEALGIPTFSMGDLLRKEIASGSELGKRISTTIDHGKNVDDESYEHVLARRMEKPDVKEGCILDAAIRNFNQIPIFERHTKIDLVLVFDISKETVFERTLKSREGEGRADDSMEALKTRLKVYKERTVPVENYYEEKGILRRIDGEQSINEVFEDALRAIKQAKPSSK